MGDVLTLHDADTGASAKDVVRPCVVLAIGDTMVVVAPRSASVAGLVPTPASASSAFSEPGCFSRWRRPIARTLAEIAANHGPLDEPYRGQVIALHSRKVRP